MVPRALVYLRQSLAEANVRRNPTTGKGSVFFLGTLEWGKTRRLCPRQKPARTSTALKPGWRPEATGCKLAEPLPPCLALFGAVVFFQWVPLLAQCEPPPPGPRGSTAIDRRIAIAP